MNVLTQENEISIIRTVQTERIVVRQIPAPGPQGPPGEFPVSVQTELEIDELYPSNHKEIVYDINGERILNVNTWNSSAKDFLIFTKVFAYTLAGKVSTVTTQLVLDGTTMVKTLTYDLNNRIISVDRLYTP